MVTVFKDEAAAVVTKSVVAFVEICEDIVVDDDAVIVVVLNGDDDDEDEVIALVGSKDAVVNDSCIDTTVEVIIDVAMVGEDFVVVGVEDLFVRVVMNEVFIIDMVAEVVKEVVTAVVVDENNDKDEDDDVTDFIV